jgi:hypothetical protein
MWTGKQRQKRDHRGKDQPALDAAALRFGNVSALPTTYNLKPNHCSSHGHLARGAVRFLHWKDKTRTKRRAEVCGIINANTTARLILGLPDSVSSKCLRIDGVALHAIDATRSFAQEQVRHARRGAGPAEAAEAAVGRPGLISI